MNLASLLNHAKRLYGGRQAVSCGEHSFTYEAFSLRVGGLASLLKVAGVGPGMPLAMLHRNCHRFLETYFAAAALGAVLVPLNFRLAPKELAVILQDSGAGLVLSEPSFQALASEAVEAIHHGQPPSMISFNREFDLRIEQTPALKLSDSPASWNDPAQYYYTSGTTGTPKGVILTHGNILSHALAAVAELRLDEKDRWLHAAPLFHLADAWATWAVTWVGGCHLMLPEFRADEAFDLIDKEQATITNLIPTMLVKMVHHPEADRSKLKSMRRILSGGAPMALELLKRIEALFPCEYVQTYGLTETSPYLTLSLLKEKMRDLPEEEQQLFRASTGRPMLGVDLKVVDPDGREVHWDGESVGEVVCRGPTVTPGYLNRPEETESAFRHGWLHTGDLAFVDAEGYLTIVDRLKDVINTGGEQVYSTEVENALYAHPDVEEAAVFAVPDPEWGEAVRAAVVLKKGAALTAAELIEHCRTCLAAFKAPKEMDFLEKLPRTGSGKIDKKVLRKPFWEGEKKMVH